MQIEELLEDALAERHISKTEQFKVRVANEVGVRIKAGALIKKRYEWRGYAVDVEPSDAPDQMTFSAEDIHTSKSIGTITVKIDGRSQLGCDANYNDILQPLRESGRRMCEFGALAIEEGLSKCVLCSLFHVAYLFATKHAGIDLIVIEVNPRHESVYRRALKFQRIGEVRTCTRVNAPAVLLSLDMAVAAEQIFKFGGTFTSTKESSSLYPYFFSPAEAEGIAKRLMSS